VGSIAADYRGTSEDGYTPRITMISDVISPNWIGVLHMRKSSIVLVLTAASVCLSAPIATAHHSVAANFDASKSVSVTGKITELDMRNPHSQITLQVPAAGGAVEEWFIEWSDVNSLIRRSVPYDRLHVGDQVTISVSPSRRLPRVGYFREAVLPGGKTLRDCGFGAFRESVAKGTALECGN
jgi:hypothetical protein